MSLSSDFNALSNEGLLVQIIQVVAKLVGGSWSHRSQTLTLRKSARQQRVKFLAERCNLHSKVQLLSWYVVCRLSVTRLYCDETAEARITRFSLESSGLSTFSTINLMAKFEWGPLDWGLKLGWGGFQLHLRRYISETGRDKCTILSGY